jgi:hypothetical protein
MTRKTKTTLAGILKIKHLRGTKYTLIYWEGSNFGFSKQEV